MIDRYLIRLLTLVTLVSCLPAKETAEKSLSTKLDSLFQAFPDFSGVVLVGENGKPVYHKAFGYKNFETKVPLDTTAIFELASVSKQFTSMVIMMLQEQGLLNYDDPIEKFIPGLPYPGITIRHLLNHTSGLPDYQAVMDQYWDKSKIAGNDENIAYLKKYHPKKSFSPGEKYEYSNTGYMLLASIAERASGEDFVDLCRDRIFRPLGMSQTDIRTKGDRIRSQEMAWGHIYVPERQKYIQADSFAAFNYSIWLGNRKGPGRVSSSASDLVKWDQALYTNALVKNASLREAYTPAKLNDGTLSYYGFGWRIAQHPRLGTKIFHAGDNPGYKTIIIRFTDSNNTLILLSNNEHKNFASLVEQIENSIHE